MDENACEIRVRFTLLSNGGQDAEKRLRSIEGWVQKAGLYLTRRGWIDPPEVLVSEPERVGFRVYRVGGG